MDGNTRVACFATDVFLRLNSWKLQVEAHRAHAVLIDLQEPGECDFERLLPWMHEHLTRL